MDALGPEDADVVVIVGDIATQLQAHLAGLRRRMPPGAVVVAFSSAVPEQTYAACGAEQVVEVDVLVRGLPPSDEMLSRVVEAIVARLLVPAGGTR